MEEPFPAVRLCPGNLQPESPFIRFQGCWGPDNPIEESPALARKGHPAGGGGKEGQKKASSFEKPAQLALPHYSKLPTFWGPRPLEKDQSLDACIKYV